MMRWKWQNRQRFDKDKRRPISGRRCPAKSGLSALPDITPKRRGTSHASAFRNLLNITLIEISSTFRKLGWYEVYRLFKIPFTNSFGESITFQGGSSGKEVKFFLRFRK